MTLCECGCGEEAKSGNRFINGHQNRGRKLSPRTSEHCAALPKSLTGRKLSSDHCALLSEAHTGVKLSPEHCAAQSAARKNIPLSPEHRVAKKKGCEKFIGGYDLVDHHYIYDESDLSKNVVKITRSDHGKLHALLHKLKYKIPHTNKPE